MMSKPFISISIRKLAISLLLLVSASASAQLKFFSIQKDSIPFFRGFAVSFDLAGLAMMELSDYGQYEGALRINLHDEWFPIAELGDLLEALRDVFEVDAADRAASHESDLYSFHFCLRYEV